LEPDFAKSINSGPQVFWFPPEFGAVDRVTPTLEAIQGQFSETAAAFQGDTSEMSASAAGIEDIIRSLEGTLSGLDGQLATIGGAFGRLTG
jgi:hypothetical protein